MKNPCKCLKQKKKTANGMETERNIKLKQSRETTEKFLEHFSKSNAHLHFDRYK